MRLKVSNVCQLLDKSKYRATTTLKGVTFTNSGDGTITVNGTNNGEIYYNLEVITSIPVGHKVIIDDRNSTLYFFAEMRDSNNTRIGTIAARTVFTLPSNLTKLNMLYFVSYSSSGVGHTYNNELSRPQLFDLTAMYGAGNEPTTVAQFRQDFPDEMYDYSPVCWKKFRRLKYVTDKYGSIDLGTLTWVMQGEGHVGGYYSLPAISAMAPHGKVYCNKYLNKTSAFGTDKNIFLGLGGSFGIQDSSFVADPVGFKQSLSGVIASFELKDDTIYETPGYLPLNRGKYIANKEPVQLLDKSKFPKTGTYNTITFTNNGDGSYTVNGTILANALSIWFILETNLKKGHVYLNNGKVDSNQKSYVECKVYSKSQGKFMFLGERFSITEDGCYSRQTLLVNGNIYGGQTISNEKLIPQLFDLTEMYGAGNEPTADEFWATYSRSTVYDYNPYNAITFR